SEPNADRGFPIERQKFALIGALTSQVRALDPLHRSGRIRNDRSRSVGLQVLPVIEVDLGEVSVLDEDCVVALGAETGGGPVSAAGQDGLRIAVLILVYNELVVADLPCGHVA